MDGWMDEGIDGEGMNEGGEMESKWGRMNVGTN